MTITRPATLNTTVAHVDCDCFFVSVELIDQPHLKGTPICVCGPTGSSGVVTAANYEARPYGIGAGTPYFQAKAMCPHATFIQGDFVKYGHKSFQLFEMLHKFSPNVEHTSIDEGYIDLINLDRIYKMSHTELMLKIQQTILEKLQIPVSIGYAPTKTLAKIASKLNKPYGIAKIDHTNLAEILRITPIKEVCGFGRRIQIKLKYHFSIHTLADYVNADPTFVKAQLGLPGLIICHELQGTPLTKLTNRDAAPKSILRSAMFPHKTTNHDFIRNWLVGRLEEAIKKLNNHNLKCETVGVFLRKQHPDKVETTTELPEPTADFTTIKNAALNLFDQIYNPQQLYRAGGVFLHNLSPQNKEQLSLFEQPLTTNLADLLNHFDKILGKNTITTTAGAKYKKDNANPFNNSY